ncbi:MAG: hypothetical protein KKB34_14800 [Bacteroidetes bacterium]|nr:hypothetical protein [Bacteroidota bacterium]
MTNRFKVWVVTADMGYGHQRAVHPLKYIAEEKIITVGSDKSASKGEEKLWKRFLHVYEFMSRAKGFPVIGDYIFGMLDALLHIPSMYPVRDLSRPSFQVKLLKSNINKGLCLGMLNKTATKNIPIVTSFFASAIAADIKGDNEVYCIICDADINRVWVPESAEQSRIKYFAPCAKAARRLKAYGVPSERIFITGFPLPFELLGDNKLSVLKSNLGKRLYKLDPSKKFLNRHEKNVAHFLGEGTYTKPETEKLKITYTVGGAGAQMEIGGRIASSLKGKILSNQVKLVLVAGIRSDVKDYYLKIKNDITQDDDQIEIIYSESLDDYFNKFNKNLHDTDVLWTKPSELSFFSALGIPIIITSPIGSQEKFNAKWLYEIQAAMKQENPDYTDQWLFELLKGGRLAAAAWSGFLNARKMGSYKIIEVLENGKLDQNNSAVMR